MKVVLKRRHSLAAADHELCIRGANIFAVGKHAPSAPIATGRASLETNDLESCGFPIVHADHRSTFLF
jgi:hypothetical protein